MAVLDWSNSQIFNLLNNKSANCFAQTSLFKILSKRLNTGANIGVAPSHTYITHTNTKGSTYNIELPTRSFPGAGSIMTYTYTPLDAVRSGIAMRTLNDKQSVALCLVYLAKAFEHKFESKTNDFITQCAKSALQYDSLNLNAMLLKAEVLEEKIVHKHKTVVQLQLDKEFKEYQNLIALLYNKGYREMPLDMKNLIIDHLKKDSTNFILANHTPRGFQSINPKDDRYATLSWGKFDEVHEPKRIEQFQRTLLDTKTMKITKFVTADTLYNNYPFDPVIAAWQIDPHGFKYPSMSPYSAFANNPIAFVDRDGNDFEFYKQDGVWHVSGTLNLYTDDGNTISDKLLKNAKSYFDNIFANDGFNVVPKLTVCNGEQIQYDINVNIVTQTEAAAILKDETKKSDNVVYITTDQTMAEDYGKGRAGFLRFYDTQTQEGYKPIANEIGGQLFGHLAGYNYKGQKHFDGKSMMSSTSLYAPMTNEGCYFNGGKLNYSSDESTMTDGGKSKEIILKDNIKTYDYTPDRDAVIEK